MEFLNRRDFDEVEIITKAREVIKAIIKKTTTIAKSESGVDQTSTHNFTTPPSVQ